MQIIGKNLFWLKLIFENFKGIVSWKVGNINQKWYKSLGSHSFKDLQLTG